MENDPNLNKNASGDQGYQPPMFPSLTQGPIGKQYQTPPNALDPNTPGRFEEPLPILYNLPQCSKTVLGPNPVNTNGLVSIPGSDYSQQKNYVLPPYHDNFQPVKVDSVESVQANISGILSSVPEKQRRRVTRACDRCRVHKIKCTGMYPCQNCLKHKTECKYDLRSVPEEFSSKRQKQNSSEPLVKQEGTSAPMSKLNLRVSLPNKESPHRELHTNITKATYSEKYVHNLQDRIVYLEKLLADRDKSFATSLENVESKTSYFPASSADDLDEDCFTNGGLNTNFACNLDIVGLIRSNLTKWRACGKSQVGLTILLCNYLHKNLSQESQAKVECPRTQYYGWNLSGCHYLRPDAIPPCPKMNGFSDLDKARLVDFFFVEINPLFAILHESVFREQLELFLSLQTDPLQQGNRTALFLAMLLLVYTLSIRFSEFLKPSGPDMGHLDVEESLFKYAHRVTQIFTLEWESFELIQCWLLVTLYLRITHKQSSSGNTLTQGISMARLMGIGLSLLGKNGAKTYEGLKSKRIFFSVFCFDRIIGLQGGKFTILSSDDICRKFPLFEYKSEIKNDDWITLPALAMIHISRLTSYIELYRPNGRDHEKTALMQQDLLRLDTWLDDNGFSDTSIAASVLSNLKPTSQTSITVRAQVYLYFCDLVISIYSKLMYQFISNNHLSAAAVDFDFLIKALRGGISVLQSLDRAGLLFSPWYITISTLISVGVCASVFISACKFEHEMRDILRDSLALLRRLQDSLVLDGTGKLIFRERFKMVNECVWVLKLVNHMIALRHEEVLRSCRDIGIDHGSSDVNKQTFGQFRPLGEKPLGLDELIESQNSRETKTVTEMKITPVTPKAEIRSEKIGNLNGEMTTGFEASIFDQASQPDSAEFGMSELFGHLQWFDQWLGDEP